MESGESEVTREAKSLIRSSNSKAAVQIGAVSPRMPKDFWMPDESCRVCYECDASFNLFNRRHHCRVCGRIFCYKCTKNTIYPGLSVNNEERGGGGERVRVCNFCLKLHKKKMANPNEIDLPLYPPVLTPSPSPSTCSLMGSNSSSVCSTPTQPGSFSTPSLNPQRCTDHEPAAAAVKPKMMAGASSNLPSPEWESSPTPYDFCNHNRSDDDDNGDDYCKDLKYSKHSRQHEGRGAGCSEINNRDEKHADVLDTHNFNKLTESKDSGRWNEYANPKCSISPNLEKTLLERPRTFPEDCEGFEGGIGVNNFYTPLYQEFLQDRQDPVDAKCNDLIWVPPLPKDKANETDSSFVDTDEERDADSCGNSPNFSASIPRSDTRSRERALLEEQRKSFMQEAIDGHFRALVAQLLSAEGFETMEDEEESWLEIVTLLSYEAASLVKPDINECGMDPREYVKVKCIATGQRRESYVVKGVVSKKNVANRRMLKCFKNPRLLLLGGSLEYHRVSNLLSSMDTLIMQEEEYLRMTVARIEAHHPNVLLVENTVSRFAHQCLLEKDISLVLNVKRPLLERIARCTGAQIVPSPDNLVSSVIGHCGLFQVENYTEVHATIANGRKRSMKSLMFFEDCPKPLGCTVLLKGASDTELKKVKHVVQFAVFAAYHWALETSFLADEGAVLPNVAALSLPSASLLPDRSISVIRSSSPLVIKTSSTSVRQSEACDIGFHVDHVPPDFLSTYCLPSLTNISALKMANRLSNPTQKNSTENLFQEQYLEQRMQRSSSKDEFPPLSDYQSILVSYSCSCLHKVCEIGHLLRIKYYGSSDMPLGVFLRDKLLNPSSKCMKCEEPIHAHVQCYTHHLGMLSISVRHQGQFILGNREGEIWMWHRCLKCPRLNGLPPVTRRVVMSNSAFRLSFGKFLELSFLNHGAASRLASCGHSLHRDCLRFYGYGAMVACFRYSPTNIYSVCLPPSKLEFNHPEQQEWLYNEVNEIMNRGDSVFAEVLKILRKIEKRNGTSSGGKFLELQSHIAELHALLKKEKSDFEEALRNASSPMNHHRQVGQAVADILELNQLRRALAACAVQWDERLVLVSSMQALVLVSDSLSCADFSFPLNCNYEMSKGSTDTRMANSDSKMSQSSTKMLSPMGICEIEDDQTQIKPVSPCNRLSNGNSIAFSIETMNFPLSSGMNSDINKDESQVGGRFSEGKVPLMSIVTVEDSTAENPRYDQDQRLNTDATGNSFNISKAQFRDVLGDKMIEHAPIRLSLPNQKDEWEQSSDISGSVSDVSASFYKGNNGRESQMSFTGSALSITPSVLSYLGRIATQGGARLFLPLGFNDRVVAVYDDEPTSIIAYALASNDYHVHISDKPYEKEKPKEKEIGKDEVQDTFGLDGSFNLCNIPKEKSSLAESSFFIFNKDESVMDLSPSSNDNMHINVSFSDEGAQGKVKYGVVCYYAKQFDVLQKKCCPNDLEFIRSLCRCKKWGAQGGKSNVFFAKTCDDRFVIKQVTKSELDSFMKFAPVYFKYLWDVLSTGSHTCIAKILGVFQVSVRQGKGGKDLRLELMVMENLLYGRHISRIYDLKGSERSRYNADPNGQNRVLLDQNLLELMQTRPIFVGHKPKRFLERAVWNDTAFLASVNVMDYSLLVGVDEERHELVVGIIDFIRQYTWDKHLETWVKSSGILGGPKNVTPTVISPQQYKKRFRKAMTNYFLVVPDQWTDATLYSTRIPLG